MTLAKWEGDGSESDLADQVRDAAVQRRFMEACAADKAFTAKDGRILYAVDFDVVRMYANPQEANRPSTGRLPYGQVFGSDPKEVAESLTIRLADFLFFRLQPRAPLLVIPPIDEELDIFLSDKIEKIAVDPPPQDFDIPRLQQLIGRIDGLEPNGAANLEEIQQAFIQILRLIHLDSGPAGEFRRVARLLNLERIAGPDSPALLAAIDDAAISQALRPLDLLGGLRGFIDKQQAWSERLRLRSGRKALATMERDAFALARLETWNESLAPALRRVVYITGSRTLFEAGWNYPVKDPESSQATTFTDMYLRHPRGFVADGGLLDADHLGDRDAREAVGSAIENESDQTLLGALRTYLTAFKTEVLDPKYPFQLTTEGKVTVELTLKEQPEIESNLRRRWDAYCQAVRPNYRPPEDVYARLKQEIGALTGGHRSLVRWDELRSHLDGLVEKARDEAYNDCFKVVARTGLSLDIFNPKSQTASRSVPPLSFESWLKTYKFIECVSGWHSSDQFDSRVYEAGLADLENDDDTGYAYYLAHAAIFAGRGRWATAGVLAERALLLARSGVAADKHVDGREAAYLLAVCRRHAAQSVEDLIPLGQIVALAKSISASEAVIRPGMEAIPERFEGELVALELTRYMFERFGPGGSHTVLPADLGDRKRSLVGRLRALDETIRGRLAQSDAMSAAEPNRQRLIKTLRRLDVRVTTNLVSIAMVDADFHQLAGETFREDAQRLVAYRTQESGPEISFFVRAVADCAQLIIEQDPSARGARKARLRESLTDKEIAAHRVFPYDEARIRYLRDLALR